MRMGLDMRVSTHDDTHMNTRRGASHRRPYTGRIPCEFCPKVIGGSSKSGLFSNYNSHVLANHRDAPYYNGPHEVKK